MAQGLRNALPAGCRLEEYEIETVLGHGGFGVTYLARDTRLNAQVAIKEYMPVELAVREDGISVHPRSEADREEFLWGLDRFLGEAQTLARFKHPNIVPVLRFFEANGTAYLVMEYQEGESLGELLRRKKVLTETELWPVLVPLLDGLAAVHEAGFLHRDIKPGNIFIRGDGSPVLIDFGSARQAIGQKSKSLTAIITAGYAPFEQYQSGSNQGPWTDIYALAGVVYRAITGGAPPEAPSRAAAHMSGKKDPMVSAVEAGRGRCSAKVLVAVDKALALRETDRPQSVADWQTMLFGGRARAPVTIEPGGRRRSATLGAAGGFLVAVLLVGGGYAAWQLMSDGGKDERDQPARATLAGARDAGPKAGDATISDVAVRQAEEETKRRAEEDARRAAEAEAKRKAAEAKAESERRAEEAVRQKAAAEEARRAAEAEAKRKAEETARRAAEAEAKRKAEETARRAAEAEAKRKAEETARRAAEAEAKRQAALDERIMELERRAKEAEARAKTAERAAKSGPPAQTARLPDPSTDNGLKALFAGNTAVFARRNTFREIAPDHSYFVGFGRDGALDGNESGSRGSRGTERGKWSVQGGRLCLQWRNWDDGESLCYGISKRGEYYMASGAGGVFQGIFELRSGARGNSGRPTQTAPVQTARRIDPADRQGLKALFAGSTVYIGQDVAGEGMYVWNFSPGGKLSGNLSKGISGIGSAVATTSDSGSWIVRQGKLCTKWSNWDGGQEHCYAIGGGNGVYTATGGGGALAGKFRLSR